MNRSKFSKTETAYIKEYVEMWPTLSAEKIALLLSTKMDRTSHSLSNFIHRNQELLNYKKKRRNGKPACITVTTKQKITEKHRIAGKVTGEVSFISSRREIYNNKIVYYL